MYFLYKENLARLAFILFLFSNLNFHQIFGMLLHAQQVMPPNGYNCDVLMVLTLTLYECDVIIAGIFNNKTFYKYSTLNDL